MDAGVVSGLLLGKKRQTSRRRERKASHRKRLRRRGAVCGVAASLRCAEASPSSRLLASDPAALATPLHTLLQQPARPDRRLVRIVSLLPSATEIVCLLGLEDSLVGVSHECDFPPKALRLPKVVSCDFDPAGLSEREIDEKVRAAMEAGRGACAIDETLLASLDPDLVITQELC